MADPLIEAMRAGDEKARNLLVLNCLGLAYKAASRFSRAEDFDDIKAECAFSLVKAVESYPGPPEAKDLDRWIWRFMQNVALHEYRKKFRRTRSFFRQFPDVGEDEQFEPGKEQEIAALCYEIFSKIVHNEIEMKLLIFKAQGLNNKESAARVGVSEPTVSRILARLEERYDAQA
jgi:RNA polymerase sigma factor (sigma-70 family)